MDFRATALPDASRVGVRRSGRPDLAARRASGPAVRVSALLAETRHALVRRLAGSQLAIRLKQQPSVVRPGSWFVAQTGVMTRLLLGEFGGPKENSLSGGRARRHSSGFVRLEKSRRAAQGGRTEPCSWRIRGRTLVAVRHLHWRGCAIPRWRCRGARGRPVGEATGPPDGGSLGVASASGRDWPSSRVDVVGACCLIDVGSVEFSLAPLAGRASVMAPKRRGEGVGRGVAGAGGDLRERQLASA